MSLLTIVIGIVFVLLLFSLLASAVMELIAGFLSLRGKHLFFAIGNMIGKDQRLPFTSHPYFQQLSIGSRERTNVNGGTERLPSYINSGTFSAILLDILEVDSIEAAEARIEAMPEGTLKRLLVFLFRQSGGELLQFKLKIEEWFNEVMERASGAYKRNSQRWLIGIGLFLAVLFNADVINIYHNLSVNTTLQSSLADAATAFVQQNPNGVRPTNLDNPDMAYAQEQIATLVTKNIRSFESPLGLGWETVIWEEMTPKSWLIKIIGWLTTAISISLGASFWFDLLKKLVNVRGSGPAPAPTTAAGITPTTNASPGGSLTRKEPENILENYRKSIPPPGKTQSSTFPKPPQSNTPPEDEAAG